MRALKECVSSQPRWDCLRTNKPNSSDYRSCRCKHCYYCKTRTSQRYSSQHILTIDDTFFSVVLFHNLLFFVSAANKYYYLSFANGLMKFKNNNIHNASCVRQHQMSNHVHHSEYISNMSKTFALPMFGIALQRWANFSKRARKNEKELVPRRKEPILIAYFCFLYKSASASTLLLNFSRTFCGETISRPAPICKMRPTNSSFTST